MKQNFNYLPLQTFWLGSDFFLYTFQKSLYIYIWYIYIWSVILLKTLSLSSRQLRREVELQKWYILLLSRIIQ